MDVSDFNLMTYIQVSLLFLKEVSLLLSSTFVKKLFETKHTIDGTNKGPISPRELNQNF